MKKLELAIGEIELATDFDLEIEMLHNAMSVYGSYTERVEKHMQMLLNWLMPVSAYDFVQLADKNINLGFPGADCSLILRLLAMKFGFDQDKYPPMSAVWWEQFSTVYSKPTQSIAEFYSIGEVDLHKYVPDGD